MALMNMKNGQYGWRIQVLAVKEAAEDGKSPQLGVGNGHIRHVCQRAI
jgi:hypothetical protein